MVNGTGYNFFSVFILDFLSLSMTVIDDMMVISSF